MSDRLFLDWPFFDDSHRRLAEAIEAWCSAELAAPHGEDVDAECRDLVRRLGSAGWLQRNFSRNSSSPFPSSNIRRASIPPSS